MAPHSSTLAWKIPRTEDPDRLQSMGSQRVGCNWVTSLSLFILPYRIPVLISFSQPCLHLHQGLHLGFPSGSVGKESPCNAGDPGLIPGLVRSPGKGNGNPLQYSCRENPMDRRAWWATAIGSQRVRHNSVTTHTCHFFAQSPSPPQGLSVPQGSYFVWLLNLSCLHFPVFSALGPLHCLDFCEVLKLAAGNRVSCASWGLLPVSVSS